VAKKSSAQKSRRVTPWDGEQDLTETQAFLKHYYDSHYMERHEIVSASGEAGMINSYQPFKCPYCSSEKFRKRGLTGSGIQRYLCECGKAFLPTTGTIFDDRKISISEWMEYCLNLFRHVSINADSWNNKNAFTTSRYWLQKLFITLQGVQDGIVLSKKVWIDETYYTVRSPDIVRKDDGTLFRGLSRNQICIGVATDKRRTVLISLGTGQPSQKKVWEAFASHITSGSILVHDEEVAHKKLIQRLSLESIAYSSKELRGLPDSDNPLNPVNRVHAILKKFLNAHSGFNRSEIQGYLDLFAFVSNPPSEPLEKVELVIKMAFQNPKSLKYRDFYGVNTGL